MLPNLLMCNFLVHYLTEDLTGNCTAGSFKLGTQKEACTARCICSSPVGLGFSELICRIGGVISLFHNVLPRKLLPCCTAHRNGPPSF